MKIDPNQAIVTSVYPGNITGLDKPADDKFGTMLREAINNEASKASAGSEKPQMANIVKESRLEPSRFHKPIKRFFSYYRNDLHEKEFRDNGKIRMAELIEAELIERINHLPENLKMLSNPALEE